MKCGISIPNFGDWADPRTMMSLALDAEAAGWDGFFVWDHIRFSATPLPVQDPWVLLAAIAATTERMTIARWSPRCPVAVRGSWRSRRSRSITCRAAV